MLPMHVIFPKPLTGTMAVTRFTSGGVAVGSRHVLPVYGRRHVEEHATRKKRILKPELETASKYDTHRRRKGSVVGGAPWRVRSTSL